MAHVCSAIINSKKMIEKPSGKNLTHHFNLGTREFEALERAGKAWLEALEKAKEQVENDLFEEDGNFDAVCEVNAEHGFLPEVE